jgi:hypothetical protein
VKKAVIATYLFCKEGTKLAGGLLVGSFVIWGVAILAALAGYGTAKGVKALFNRKPDETAQQVAAVEAAEEATQAEAEAPAPVENETVAAIA